MTRYYITPKGQYIGGFDGALPPFGSVEVPFPPADARYIWDGKQFVPPPAQTSGG